MQASNGCPRLFQIAPIGRSWVTGSRQTIHDPPQPFCPGQVQGSIASAAELGDGEAVLSQPLADGLTIFGDSRIKSGVKALDDEGSLRGVEFPSLVNEAHSDGFGWLWIPQLKVLDKGIQPSQVKHRRGTIQAWGAGSIFTVFRAHSNCLSHLPPLRLKVLLKFC
jgi:hypothetical protein